MTHFFHNILLFLFITSITPCLFAQNVGIGTAAPLSKLSVNGNFSIGSSYISQTAPVNGAIIQGSVRIGTSTPTQKLEVVGNIKSSSLAGTGSRMVVADATGIMSTQAIPSGVATASNGLTATAGNITLGGTLTAATTIANAGFNLNITGTGKLTMTSYNIFFVTLGKNIQFYVM